MTMKAARIAELLKPFLGENQELPDILLHISIYIDILIRWNERINLTAIRDPEQIVTRHFGESLFAARHLFPPDVGTAALGGPAGQSSAATQAMRSWHIEEPSREVEGAPGPAGAASKPAARDSRERAALQGREAAHELIGASAPVTLADVGSGAGFPGIPIKLWAPAISLTLIESNHKKATFLREVARALTLTDINIQNTRAEALPQASFDVVTLRAVERFDQVLPAAAALLKSSGRLTLLLGSSQVPQARALLPGHDFNNMIPIPHSRSRVLLI